VELVGVNQVKLDAVHGREDLSAGDVVSWPGAVGGAPERLTFPDPAGWAVKLYGDQGPAGRAVITDPRAGERLELVVDRSEVPQVGAWIDCGWSRAGADQRLELALAPCIGAPDRLEEAVGDWGLARALKPGEEVGWELALWLPEPESP
jgi:hypothetical protein